MGRNEKVKIVTPDFARETIVDDIDNKSSAWYQLVTDVHTGKKTLADCRKQYIKLQEFKAEAQAILDMAAKEDPEGIRIQARKKLDEINAEIAMADRWFKKASADFVDKKEEERSQADHVVDAFKNIKKTLH